MRAIALASIVIFAAAWIGLSLRLHPDVVTTIALALVLPIGLIPITLPWFAMVAKARPRRDAVCGAGLRTRPEVEDAG